MSVKKALIITDSNEAIDKIAHMLESVLVKNYNVKVCSAQEFEGTDLLASGIFFIGSSSAGPLSFKYLEELLLHINLASRKCVIFSDNKKTIKYLKNIVKDCEASCAEPLLISEEISEELIINSLKEIIT